LALVPAIPFNQSLWRPLIQAAETLSWCFNSGVALRKPERQVHIASHCGSKQQRSHAMIIPHVC